jgi:hypothetical protein
MNASTRIKTVMQGGKLVKLQSDLFDISIVMPWIAPFTRALTVEIRLSPVPLRDLFGFLFSSSSALSSAGLFAGWALLFSSAGWVSALLFASMVVSTAGFGIAAAFLMLHSWEAISFL